MVLNIEIGNVYFLVINDIGEIFNSAKTIVWTVYVYVRRKKKTYV